MTSPDVVALPVGDGTAWREDGTREGDGTAGWAIVAAVLLVAAIVAWCAVRAIAGAS